MMAKSKKTKANQPQTEKEKGSTRPCVLPYMQNRELSWLTFNKRVLDQGEDHNVPLLERLTFVSIFSSNLQEFFMVRVGSLTDLSLVNKELRDNKTQMTPDEQLRAIYDRCHELYPEQERIFNQILEKLAERGIRQLKEDELNEEQQEYLHEYLNEKVVPYLSPQIINSRHPFPHLENGALYVLLRLDEETNRKKASSEDAKKKEKNLGADDATFGLVPLPRQATRVIPLPGAGTQFILLENALKTIVSDVFSMYTTKRASVICVTRNADIDPNDGTEDMDYDYREHMKRILKKRARLAPVRLETDTPLSPVTKRFLLKRLGLKMHQVYVTSVPLDMGYAWGLADMIDPDLAQKITNEPFNPTWPACLDKKRSIMEQVCEKDIMLSYPYESMDPFIMLLKEAANDPSVISIKITLYRLASQSHLAEALLAAAENGKEVTALFELRARFDESNNIEWSQRFEQAGAHVIYGFHDFKVHSKICAITRHTDRGIQHITQLGTGNYNEKTSKLYTDLSFITTNEAIGKDAAEFFRNMGLENASDTYKKLSVAPLQIKPMILQKIDEQIELARQNEPNGLIFKTNSITDKDIIDKIAEASQAGVHTTLFVRGISCLVPGIEGYTDNVEVVSIVGRLLEHSRVYGFGPRDNRELYLSSADLMTRNMEKRVEIAWPIENPEIKEAVNNYLDISLADTAKLRKLKNDLEYTPLEYFSSDGPDGIPESFDSQAYLIKKAREDYERSLETREEQAAQRSAIARAQRIRDREILSAAVTPLIEDPQTGETLIGGTTAASTESETATPSGLTGEPESHEPHKAVIDETATESASASEASEVSSEDSRAPQSDAQKKNTAPQSEAEQPHELGNEAIDEHAIPQTSEEQQEQSTQQASTPSSSSSSDGIEEVEPGVAGPASRSSSSTYNAQTSVPIVVAPEAEALPHTQEEKPNTIQLVPKRAGIWTRIKFLFTGRL